MNQQPNLWDERYRTEEYVFGTEPNDFLRDNVARLQLGPVCCIGDGEGRNGVFLARSGFEVTSVDLSSVGLAKAAQLAAAHGVGLTTIAANLAEWVRTPAAAGPWSSVVSIFCHLPSAVRAIVYPALIEAMAPGGTFLLEAYRPEQIGRGTGGPGDPDLLLTAELARRELAGLQFEHLEELERDVSEGSLHTGTALVVQVLARKA
ncbi:MAG: methyltransferase domain-containing protein [Acidimicrobiales bacterium]